MTCTRTAGRLWSCALAACLWTPQLLGQVSFEEVLPPETLAAVLVDDVSALTADLQASSWGRFFGDPACAPAKTMLMQGLAQWSTESAETLGVDPLELLGMVSGGAALAVLELGLPEIPGGDPALALGLLLDLGEQAEAFGDGLDTLLGRAVDQAGLVLKNETVRQLPVAVLLDAEGEKSALRYGLEGTVLVVTIVSPGLEHGDHFGRLVDGLRGEAELVLADAEDFVGTLAARKVLPVNGLRVWADVGGFVTRLMQSLKSKAPTTPILSVELLTRLESLGLSSMGSMASVSWMEAGRSFSRGRFNSGAEEGLFEVIGAAVGAQRPNLLSLVPAGVQSAFAADINLDGVFDATLELITRVDPDTGWAVVNGLAEAEVSMGFHPKDDLIDRLDGQIAVLVSEVPAEQSLAGLMGGPDLGGPPQNFALLLGLRDGVEVATLLDGIVRKNGLHAARTRIEFEGFEIQQVPLFPVTLSYAVLDDLFVFSLAPSLVQDVLRRRANPGLANLAASDDFRAARALLPEDATVLSYSRGGDQLRDLLATLRHAQKTGELELNPLDPRGLPLSEKLLEFLRSLPLPSDEVVDRHVKGAEVSSFVLDEDGSFTLYQVAP